MPRRACASTTGGAGPLGGAGSLPTAAACCRNGRERTSTSRRVGARVLPSAGGGRVESASRAVSELVEQPVVHRRRLRPAREQDERLLARSDRCPGLPIAQRAPVPRHDLAHEVLPPPGPQPADPEPTAVIGATGRLRTPARQLYMLGTESSLPRSDTVLNGSPPSHPRPGKGDRRVHAAPQAARTAGWPSCSGRIERKRAQQRASRACRMRFRPVEHRRHRVDVRRGWA
jgi:hypothetical protein